MHDAVSAERLGVPAAAVMTTEFRDAAELMGHVLGMPDYRFAVIEHPISSADDAGLRRRARDAASQIARLLVG